MKIFQEGSVYVQKGDVNEIVHMDPIDGRVMAALVEAGGGFFCCGGGTDNLKFINIAGEQLVEWVRAQEWILDYDEVKDMTEQEAMAFGHALAEEKNKIATHYNKMSGKEREKNYKEVYTQCEDLMKKMRQVAMFIDYLRGELDFEFPANVEPPKHAKLNKGPRKSIFSRVRSLFTA